MMSVDCFISREGGKYYGRGGLLRCRAECATRHLLSCEEGSILSPSARFVVLMVWARMFFEVELESDI